MRRIGRLRRLASPSKVAVIGQPATAPMTRRQPVPELPKSSTPCGSRKAADADTVNAPGALAGPLDGRAQRPHGLGGVDHVLAFQQPGDAGLADRERAEDQGAVRDRLVAGHAHAALEGARAAGGERGWDGVIHWQSRLCAKTLSSMRPYRRHPGPELAHERARGSCSGAIDSGTATRQVKHLISDPLEETGPWQNPSSAPSASAAIAARNSTISARPDHLPEMPHRPGARRGEFALAAGLCRCARGGARA